MFDFEKTYAELVAAEGGAVELRPLLGELYASLVEQPPDFARIKAERARGLHAA